MGRPSKLSDKQRQEIERRLLDGEKASALAKEFGISRSTFSETFSERTKRVKATAGLLVEAETAFQSLSFSEQVSARSLAATLASISGHLAAASNYGAMTSHRLSGIAHGQIEKIDDADPMKSDEALKAIAVLTKIANSSAEIGLNLLRANKDAQQAEKSSAADVLLAAVQKLPG